MKKRKNKFKNAIFYVWWLQILDPLYRDAYWGQKLDPKLYRYWNDDDTKHWQHVWYYSYCLGDNSFGPHLASWALHLQPLQSGKI